MYRLQTGDGGRVAVVAVVWQEQGSKFDQIINKDEKWTAIGLSWLACKKISRSDGVFARNSNFSLPAGPTPPINLSCEFDVK